MEATYSDWREHYAATGWMQGSEEYFATMRSFRLDRWKKDQKLIADVKAALRPEIAVKFQQQFDEYHNRAIERINLSENDRYPGI